MRLRDEPSVEETNRLDGEASVTSPCALLVTREQLLRHAVSVVVREHVDARGAELAEEALMQRRLVYDRVVVPARLVRPAEADHVGRDDAKTRRQLGP